MQQRLANIQKHIDGIDFVTVDVPFKIDEDYNISGKILLHIDEVQTLPFSVIIQPEYPLRRHDTETIKFLNSDLLHLNHVMGTGLICIHTSHNPILEKKLNIDFASLRRWVNKYYINREEDSHYEHLILQPKEYSGNHYSYFFTDVNYRFAANEFGYIDYQVIQSGTYYKLPIQNHVVHSFYDKHNAKIADCEWSESFRRIPNGLKKVGLFVFLGKQPAALNKFAFNNWQNLQGLMEVPAITFLHNFQRKYQRQAGSIVPVLIGYNISDTEVHWQAIVLEVGRFPIVPEKVNQVWQGRLLDEAIYWGITKNCSYNYFFGRGKLHEGLTNGRILIIGVGAIGSIIATSLTRGGCKSIDIIDFDVKEPENVCRSEYNFITGINNKENDLTNLLYSISPFINIGVIDEAFFNLYLKTLLSNEEALLGLQEQLQTYTAIFDCSADNDLLYIFSKMTLPNFVSMSIANKATALVCSTETNSYNWVINQFENVLQSDEVDLYNPTGCWSPTFKASYNDINVLVQNALKHINLKYCNHLPLRNFVLQTDNSSEVKLQEF